MLFLLRASLSHHSVSFGAGFVGCEHPFDAGAGGVSLSLPCGDFADKALGVVDSAVQALAAEHADLDLDHIEPTGVLGGVVELQAAQNSPGFGGRECLIEGAGRVGRQVVPAASQGDFRISWREDIELKLVK